MNNIKSICLKANHFACKYMAEPLLKILFEALHGQILREPLPEKSYVTQLFGELDSSETHRIHLKLRKARKAGTPCRIDVKGKSYTLRRGMRNS